MTPDQIERYARHLVLKEIGGPGQNKLREAKIAIIGAGGLGGPVALYLAAAGLGHLTVIDDDQIELSNLQRQIQFGQSDIGQDKAQILAQRLSELNSDCQTTLHSQRLNIENADALLKGHDLIIDGTDNFETRFLVNDLSLSLGIPLLSGALGRFDGQIALFNTNKDSPCYRCFVPHTPPQAQTCSEVGVVGALAGIIGSAMALEAIKFICDIGDSLAGHIWLYDGLSAQARRIGLPKDPKCPHCG